MSSLTANLSGSTPNSSGQQGGLLKLYAIKYSDLQSNTTTGIGASFSQEASGKINKIGISGSASFVQIGLLRSTAKFDSSWEYDYKTGNNFSKISGNVNLPDLTITNQSWVDTVKTEPLVLLYSTRNGVWLSQGYEGLGYFKTITNTTGDEEGTQIGYTLTWDNVSNKDPYVVVGTYSATLIS